MREDWDARARENPYHFVDSSRHDWTVETFISSGEESVRAFVLEDLAWICRANQPNEMRILEIGCGAGRMTRALSMIFGEVHAVDVSGEMVAKATARLAHLRNVRFVECDGYTLPVPDGSVGLVFSHIVLQHTPRHVTRGYVAEAFRVLRPGGDFLFQMPEAVPGAPPDPPVGDTFEMRFWSEADLRGAVSEYRS